jgi:hypothetical protein
MLVLIPLLFAMMGAGCNSDSGTPASAGPIDGTYTHTSEVCSGTPASVGTAHLIISNATGSYVVSLISGCVITMGNTIVYSGTNGIAMTQVTKACSGTCSGSECTADSTVQPSVIGTYSLSGSTLTLTFTNYICSSHMGGGSETDVNTLTKI